MLIKKTTQILNELKEMVEGLSPEDYATPVVMLSNASIGQHVRHILEFFECLLQSRSTGVLNYDLRKRDVHIEKNPAVAVSVLTRILEQIDVENMDITLQQQYLDTSGQVELPTNYFREIMYNIEHAVHHQALIRIGVQALRPELPLPRAFGVADSTIQYRNEMYSNAN